MDGPTTLLHFIDWVTLVDLGGILYMLFVDILVRGVSISSLYSLVLLCGTSLLI